MFIYLPDDGEILGKLLSTSAITQIVIVESRDSYHVKIFYWETAGRIGDHIIFSDSDETVCQNYLENLSQRLPSITLMGAPALDSLVQ